MILINAGLDNTHLFGMYHFASVKYGREWEGLQCTRSPCWLSDYTRKLCAVRITLKAIICCSCQNRERDAAFFVYTDRAIKLLHLHIRNFRGQVC